MMKAVFRISLMDPPINIIGVKELWPLSRLQVASLMLADLQRYFTVFLNFVGNEWLSTCCWRTFELSLTILGLWWQRPEPIGKEGGSDCTCLHLSAQTVGAWEETRPLAKDSPLLLKRGAGEHINALWCQDKYLNANSIMDNSSVWWSNKPID